MDLSGYWCEEMGKETQQNLVGNINGSAGEEVKLH